jgi:hypothetical protein
MTEVIVDTNVAVVANGQNNDVVQSCRDACARFIIDIQAGRVVLIDSADEIRAEYAQAVSMGRPYQLGAQFLLHVLQNQYNSRHVRRIDLSKRSDGSFEDFPDTPDLAAFDRSDRKFAALARKTGVAVANATDSDWADHSALLNAHGIAVDFLCGQGTGDWFKRKRRRSG